MNKNFKKYKLKEIVNKNKYKQLGASELEALNTNRGLVKLLPSSKNYDWWTTEDLTSNHICEGKVITLGRARYPNTKYHDGKFISANNHIISVKNENQLNPRYLYHFVLNNAQDFYVTTSTYPKFDNNVFDNYIIPLPSIEVQNEIVEVLDKFSALEAELEAELEARTKQYEYYRNKLLDFSTGSVGVPRIDKMITEMCPEGIFFTTLKEVSAVLRGKRLTKKELSEKYHYPVMHGGRTPLGFYVNSNRKANTTIVINTGSSSGEVYFMQEEFWSSDACFSIYPSDSYLDKFLYYYLLTKSEEIKSKIRTGAMPTIDKFAVEDIEVPQLNIEIQTEIVKILDNFSEYVTSTSQGLPAEIAARRKQYEYYRNKLLTFDKE